MQLHNINVSSYIYGVFGIFGNLFNYSLDCYAIQLYNSDLLQDAFFFANILLNKFAYYIIMYLSLQRVSGAMFVSLLLLDDNISDVLDFQYYTIMDCFFNYNC